jgi:hypothetical protein
MFLCAQKPPKNWRLHIPKHIFKFIISVPVPSVAEQKDDVDQEINGDINDVKQI